MSDIKQSKCAQRQGGGEEGERPPCKEDLLLTLGGAQVSNIKTYQVFYPNLCHFSILEGRRKKGKNESESSLCKVGDGWAPLGFT